MSKYSPYIMSIIVKTYLQGCECIIAMTLLGKRVMLVDNEPDTLTVLKMVLESSYGKVDAFSKPKVALDAFVMQSGPYDLMVTDVRMPQMSGIELAGKIHAIKPEQEIHLSISV